MEGEVPGWILQLLLTKCQPTDVARCACVNRRWRLAASDDSLWKDFCSRYFDVSETLDLLQRPCASFKETFDKWHADFYMYPSSLVVRAKRCWQTLRQWMESNFPDVVKSLLPGASQEELDEVEKELGWKLPMPVRLLYQFCNGQETPWSDFDEDHVAAGGRQNYIGLLGGYDFYHHLVNVHLLPLPQVLAFTQHFLPRWGIRIASNHVLIAASCNLNKFFFLNCNDGTVHVGTKKLVLDGEMIPCVPPLQNPATNENCLGPQDDMLRWLEEYCLSLQNGMFRVRKNDGLWSISLFPENEPFCTEAVTCGVQVRCSAVFVPELSTLAEDDHNGDDDENDKYLFCYSVRMRLLPSGMGSTQHSLVSCQLSRRHWIIRADDEVISEIHAEAVIGMFPLLQSGGKTFIYASCSSLTSSSGSIEGDFTFVPGNLRRREGPDFLVRVARFPLKVPRFIF